MRDGGPLGRVAAKHRRAYTRWTECLPLEPPLMDAAPLDSGPFDACVVGAGPAGLAAALALRGIGARVVLIDPRSGHPNEDTRTTALFPASLRLLASVGAGIGEQEATPLSAIRLVDRTRWLLKAPETLFEARELGLPHFGLNVANSGLIARLDSALLQADGLTWRRGTTVTGVECGNDGAQVRSSDGSILRAKLVVGADGRNSVCRAAAGIRIGETNHDQSALAVSFEHTRPHNNVSTEIHRDGGPFTTVPLAGNRSSLVWVDRPAVIERLLALDPIALAAEIETHVRSFLGQVTATGPARGYPITGQIAEPIAKNRIALVGEAAHVLPPIGAQGLNLGFRDVAALADFVEDALKEGRDPGGAKVLVDYASARTGDITGRRFAVHALNQSLISGLLPLHLARGAGLHLLNLSPVLRRMVMRQGLAPSGPLPRLMREAA